VCAQRELHRQPGVRVGQLVAEQLLELVDPVPEGLRGTARALAAATGQHYTRVSKIEHGVQALNDADIRAWCRACGADDQVPDLIATQRAVESAYLEFRRQSRAGMKRVLGAHTRGRYERTKLFRIYEHNVIPGLFQTSAYCAAMLSFWMEFLGTTNDLDEAVKDVSRRYETLLTFKYTGPWPPYNFVNIKLKLEKASG
jgi:hypothetical protein